MKWTKTLLAASIAAAASGASYADDLKINGFISLKANMLADGEPAPQFAEADEDIDFKRGSVFGIQLSKQVNDKVSITGQLVSRGLNDFDTDATWAYVTYQAADSTAIRVGRLRAPFFKYSDFLEVGYAYHWARPPQDVYARIPFSSVEGIDVTHSFSMGDIEASVQAYFGGYEGEFSVLPDGSNNNAPTRLELTNFKGLVFNADWESWNFRASYHSADLTSNAAYYTDTSTLLGGIISQATSGAITAAPTGLISEFNINEKESVFYELAVKYDDGDNLVVAEWTQLEHEAAFFVDHDAYVLSYARKLGDFQPHISYSYQEQSFSSTTVAAPGLPPALAATFGSVGAVQRVIDGAEDGGPTKANDNIASITVGLRYDIAPSTALKFDIQEREFEAVDGSTKDNTLYTLALDVIF